VGNSQRWQYGTFNNLSDRSAKQDFAPVNPAQILEAVAALPVSEWSYKEDPVTRHIGPVAQDFHDRFKVGTDERHIAPMDEGGVALAAIQGLNQKLEYQNREKDARIRALERQVAELTEAMRGLAVPAAQPDAQDANPSVRWANRP
jgi:hypothetical protein